MSPTKIWMRVSFVMPGKVDCPSVPSIRLQKLIRLSPNHGERSLKTQVISYNRTDMNHITYMIDIGPDRLISHKKTEQFQGNLRLIFPSENFSNSQNAIRITINTIVSVTISDSEFFSTRSFIFRFENTINEVFQDLSDFVICID